MGREDDLDALLAELAVVRGQMAERMAESAAARQFAARLTSRALAQVRRNFGGRDAEQRRP